MLALFFGVVLLGVLLISLSAQKTYSYVPVKELKRQARRGDELAKILYEAAAYGLSLRLLLWVIISLSAAGSFICFQIALPGWFTFIALVFVLWVGFLWMPVSRLSAWGARLVAYITPGVAWLLRVTHPLLDRISGFINRHRPIVVHTGLYEREDIIDLLDSQAVQADNRIDPADLLLARQSLLFGDQLVREIITPRRMIKAVSKTDAIGPVLMDELYESGHSRFPVYGEGENVVGIMYLKDAVRAAKGGTVEKLMREEVFYVHEDHSLRQVLHAFLQTKHHLFIVVNEFEEYVGLVTIEDVIEQILGQPIVDEFDKYDDIRAVAASLAAVEHTERNEAVVELTDDTPPAAQ